MSFFETIENVLRTLLYILVCIILVVITNYFFGLSSSPYDDLETFAKNINCEKNWCNISFALNVEDYYNIAPTGSMVPSVGGNDVVICGIGTPKVGDFVIANGVIHQLYSINNGWVKLKGVNNDVTDAFEFPVDKIDCIVMAVIR